MLSRLRTWHLRTGFSAVIKKGVNGAATLVFFSSQTISRQKYFVAEFCALSRHSIPSCHSESLETESIAPSIRGEKKKHPERKPDCKGGGGEQVTCIFATSLNSSFRLFAASVGRSFSINQRWFSTRTVGTGGPVDQVRTADPYVATELALDAVVKIFTVSSSPNYFLPWQNKPQREVTGSGFVISRRRIVTNAHVVADQTFVLVCKHGSPIKYRADVEAVGHECDLALLRVRSEEFWEGMRELDFGDIPFLQESVAVVGYPQGGDNISVTGGVVSRVEPTQYVHGAAHLMAIQIDAAINPGNSGGPALMEDKVVGVAFQNLAGAENIGYIIPVPVINHFLSDVEETGRYVGFCSLGVTCQPTENVQLRDHLRMPLGLTGVLINKIHPLTNTSRCLQKDDVILAFDGTPIANDGTGHIEKFWLDFLADPSALWDHHLSEKVSPKYLDFKHKKKTHEAFWRWKPPWVEAAEMATYKSLLQKCTYSKNLAEGRNVHLHIIESGVKPSTSLSNAILNMYCKCGSLIEAQKVFDAIPEKDIITWTLMLVAYASHGLNGEGFKLYKQVCDEGLRCDRIMYTSIVSICASLGDLEKAKAVHNDIIKSGIGTDAILENNLVHMYARCGSMELAHDVFHKMVERNVVSWNAMIAGSAQNGNAEETCHLFQQMQQESIQPDHITFMSLLNACTSPATYKQGCWVHANILNTGWDADVRVGTALVSMFAKCGRIHDARQVFDKMKVRDVISWTAMINGYADHGPYGKAMELFRQMEQFGMAPNTVTFIGLLKACANQASLQEARWVHASIVAAALDSDLRVRNGLIDMYAKCGSLEDAFSIFSTMSEKDVVTWSAMIAGFGQHGHGRAALEHFDQMVSEGVHPNSVTFVGVLSACSHAGLVVEGLRCFHLMVKDYSISPALDHFGCVVDLLGRAGHLHEAEDFLNKMPQTPGTSTWGPLLSACRIHGNVQLAERSGTNFKIVTFNRESSLVHNDFKT